MDIKIFMIDDDDEICKQTKEILEGETIAGNKIKFEYSSGFDEGIKELTNKSFDLLILDLYRGQPSPTNTDRPGEEILKQIQKSCFVPVIFFSGLVNPVKDLESDIVRIVRKSDGTKELKKEIENVLDSKLLLLKKKLDDYLTETMRTYFWDFVHPEWSSLKEINDDVSLGYLLIRRFANSFSKEKIIKLIEDPKIKIDKAHPMEFYLYPPIAKDYETGDILEREENIFVLLTPSCDFILRNGKRKAENCMLVKAKLLKDTEEYKIFKESENKDKLQGLITNRRGERYFFLPKTPFISNCVLDYQDIIVIPTEDLPNYKKIAKLDNPYAQSMLARFIRYYNRIGHEDIDPDYVLDNLD